MLIISMSRDTSVTVFVLLGLLNQTKLQLILYTVFLGTYLMTLIWNLGLIILIRMYPNLKMPMYLFLGFLSLIDTHILFSISPRMLLDFLKAEETISFIACATQYFFLAWMGMSECCLLAAMAYDRYMAIGNPLQYSSIMAPNLCWRMFCSNSCLFYSHYCGPNVIHHFFCDMPQIIPLSCSDPFISQLVLFLTAVFVRFGSFLVILLSYVFIAVSILKIASLKGCDKALKTCGPHMATVTLFYGTVLSVYKYHSSQHSTNQDKVLSVVYAILIPMLNPLIYSLRNTEIKGAPQENDEEGSTLISERVASGQVPPLRGRQK
ncbi:Olfr1432 [Phodopus roborovskii]|uniref:Olfactory receptor n=1 Tax=Phodopus roborovskii TaxID=109678 RepID=A0AAU9ZQ63_PHORO|nr:Olfr1432 [Phodopus roborovskii]